jgi:ATP-dependent helicase/nuclease subunit B
VLWDRVLRERGAAERLLFLDATVAACMKSEGLIRDYCVPLDDPAWRRSEESELYLKWLSALEQICDDEGWMLGARLPELLAEHAQDMGFGADHRILLAGFDEPTPSQWKLFESIAGCGAEFRVLEQPVSAPAKSISIAVAGDAESEWRAAAAWAAERVARNPDGRFAVIVPELSKHLERVEQIFLDTLHPVAKFAYREPEEKGFNISYAPPLSEHRLAQAGLRLLEVLRDAPSIEDLRYVLRCPWLAGASPERDARAEVEGQLLALRLDRVPLETLVDGPAIWQGHVAQWREHVKRMREPAKRSPSEWAEFVREVWTQCLWIAPPTLTSGEYQARHRVLEELGAMGELDRVLPKCTWQEFLHKLQRRFENARFQPEATTAAVLVAGMFEVTGLSFDAVWVSGLNDDALPRAVDPDPFLPTSLQRQCGVPGSSASRELTFARSVFERLLCLAPDITLSYARRKDEEELEPSPLLSHFEAPRFEIDLPRTRVHGGAGDFERLDDWRGGELPPEVKQLPGGSRLLADQSACPFRAFVQGRLGSEDPEWEAPLMSPLDQGSMLHRALELFWRETGSQQRLKELSEAERISRIEKSVDQALEGFRVPPGDELVAAQRMAERERLVEVLTRWLEEELCRAPFAVDQTEQKRAIAIGEARVSLRLDRVDVLQDGSVALIDYKSGVVDPKKWLGDRPEEPQLLLYMTTEQRRVSALAFGCLKPDSIGWKVYGENVSANFRPQARDPLSPDEWYQFQENASNVVERLREELRQGFAPVAPRDVTTTCVYCAQKPLCRIGALRTKDGDIDLHKEDV